MIVRSFFRWLWIAAALAVVGDVAFGVVSSYLDR